MGLKEMAEYYRENRIPEDIENEIKRELGIDLETNYSYLKLKNPVLVAPGQLTLNENQIERIYKSNFAGCVLKSVIGEDENGNCSMMEMRKPPTRIETFYEENDKNGEFPIIHWDGRGDTRDLNTYLDFAKRVKEKNYKNFVIISSYLCHLPKYDEKLKEKEWIYTTKRLYETGYRIFEIDFCPFLKWTKKQEILRWYREIPSLIKSNFPDIKIFPKIINSMYGIEFQLKIIEQAIKGKSDGVVIANRIYKQEYNSGHGGEELRLLNLKQIEEAKKVFPEIEISATGGIYSGKHIFEYLKKGAKNVQLLSFLMGRVKKPFVKKDGDKFQKVFYKLLFDMEDGLLSLMIKEGYKSIKEIGGEK